jgi:hypothetical protein
MLQHRLIDDEKPRGSWVAKLRQAAQYAVETTPPDQFSSSKGAGFSEWMQKRALNDILPNLFEIAALYENHIALYKLYEGTRRMDPGYGTSVTWHRITRPPRRVARAKRIRKTKTAQVPRTESDVDASGSETEVDDTMTRAHLQRTRQARSQAQQLQNPRQHAPETPAPTVPTGASSPSTSQQDRHVLSLTTSNTCFGQHMYGIRLNEEMDANMPSYARQIDQVHKYPSNLPMQYSGYNFPVFQHQEDTHSPHSAQSSFGSEHVPSFAHPLSVFDAPCPPQDDGFAVPMASNNAGFPYEYKGAFMFKTVSNHSNGSFHGLPHDPNANY